MGTTRPHHAPNLDNIYVLAEPVLPLSLHGVNPRTIMDATAWGRVKKQTQERADHHCEICGRFVAHKPGDWVETHEVYNVDHTTLVYRLARFVGLCSTCHQYVHLGRTQALARAGQIKSCRLCAGGEAWRAAAEAGRDVQADDRHPRALPAGVGGVQQVRTDRVRGLGAMSEQNTVRVRRSGHPESIAGWPWWFEYAGRSWGVMNDASREHPKAGWSIIADSGVEVAKMFPTLADLAEGAPTVVDAWLATREEGTA